MEFRLNQNRFEFEVDLEIYSLDILHKCFYWYAGSFAIDIDRISDAKGLVRLCPKEGMPRKTDWQSLQEKIKTDLIDFKTRDIITNETANVRDLLIAKAFSHSDEHDTPPIGDIPYPNDSAH
jgi:His-Xaa-Ser system protein HxsD